MRRFRVALAAAVLVTSTGIALPAAAADTVSTIGELTSAAATCPSGDSTAVVGAAISAPATDVTVSCDLIIDLAGYAVDLRSIDITSGQHLTITDTVGGGVLTTTSTWPAVAGIRVAGSRQLTITGHASVVASSLSNAAAIGGGFLESWGDIVISGDATVTADGGDYAAGIGGGVADPGGVGAVGTITITDNATVTATGGEFSAGIGGGDLTNGGATVISGQATVVAIGSNSGAGIGGGYLGDGASVTVTGNARVTATGGTFATGIGGGHSGAAGTLDIGAGAVVTASGGVSAVGGGSSTTSSGTMTVAGTLHIPTGDLRVYPSANYTITPTGQLLGIDGDETHGATISQTGTIVNNGVIALDASLVSANVSTNNYLVSFDTQGGTDPAPVRVFGPSFDVSYRTLPVAPAGTAWNTADDGNGAWFDATTTIAGDVTLYAIALVPTHVDLTAPALSVDEGESLTFTVAATDQQGNAVSTDGVVLTSSVATDIIDGLTVTFPTASPHTITATLGEATASVVIEVIPTPADDTDGVEDDTEDTLPQTGPADAALFGGASALLIGIGIGMIWYSNRARREREGTDTVE